MSALTDRQVGTIAEAAVLISIQGGLLSDFERELVGEIAERFRRFHRNAVVTPAEWLAFSPAVDAMRQAEKRAADLAASLAQAAFLARTRAA